MPESLHGLCGVPWGRPARKHSLREMGKVPGNDEIPDNAGVAIEYRSPQRPVRFDFAITAHGPGRRPEDLA